MNLPIGIALTLRGQHHPNSINFLTSFQVYETAAEERVQVHFYCAKKTKFTHGLFIDWQEALASNQIRRKVPIQLSLSIYISPLNYN